MKANVWGNYKFQVNNTKNATGKRRLTSGYRSRSVSTSCEERHKKPFSLTCQVNRK